MADPLDPLDALIERLERTAAELRAGELSPERAAALLDECARLAGEAGPQLDRAARVGDEPGSHPPGQLPLQ